MKMNYNYALLTLQKHARSKRTKLICFIAIIFMVAGLSLHAVSASRDFIAGIFQGSCVVDQETVVTLLPCEVRARFS